MNLTIETLTHEFHTWKDLFGNGRNASDIRFGQHIHNKYDLYYSGNVLMHPNGFYTEDVNEAFSHIFKCQFVVDK